MKLKTTFLDISFTGVYPANFPIAAGLPYFDALQDSLWGINEVN